jgi:hypothetical protein
MNNLLHMLKNHFVVILLGAIVLYWGMSQYKASSEGMAALVNPNTLSDQKRKQYHQEAAGQQGADIGNVFPSTGLENVQYATVSGATTMHGLPPSCTPQQTVDPMELLPKDVNSQWAQLNPTGAGDLKGVNLLSAGALIGIDTIGNTLRNANLQVRSEPPNPQLNVGPWNNTTIAPDLMRIPLELGCGGQ